MHSESSLKSLWRSWKLSWKNSEQLILSYHVSPKNWSSVIHVGRYVFFHIHFGCWYTDKLKKKNYQKSRMETSNNLTWLLHLAMLSLYLHCRVQAVTWTSSVTELTAGTFFLLLQQVLQCSEFCTVPGSKIASSKIQVLLGHAAVYHADRASLIFRWCSQPTVVRCLIWYIYRPAMYIGGISVSKEEQKYIRKVVWIW